IDNLGIEDVIIPALYEGVGTVRCQHGVLPVPVPAVLNIVNAENITLSITGVQGEFVTPTGAAIAAAICTEKKLPEKFRVVKTG
ncbi:pyridinium-3,5-bisthiocarboxylic acid mononucleotide nickel chelatase, partial [Acinetobacter sp. 163]|nr:pyridinium-3,5-bisthiocarboxylic acid mononucleotide nickel chelatase [Acinetobacter sp. 163]